MTAEKMLDWSRRQRAFFLQERQDALKKNVWAADNRLTLAEIAMPGKEMDAVLNRMDAFHAANPTLPGCLLKARLHELIAEECDPVVFLDNPFYFETGLGRGCYGSPQQYGSGPGNWLINKRFGRVFWGDAPQARPLLLAIEQGFFPMASPASFYHIAFNSTRILEEGFEGVLAEIAREKPNCASQHERDFLEAAERGVNAVLLVADKFAAKARALLQTQDNPHWRRIAEAAAVAPRKPARTFYEGLAVLKFLHELGSVMEGVVVSIVGHPDRQLAALYERDLAAGRLTPDSAKELLGLWLDVFVAQADNPSSETNSTVMLGGCDQDGKPVFNDITRTLFSLCRQRGHLQPKLNCRFGQSSPDAWLELLAATIKGGFNAFALLNDDALIPANVKTGKRLADARRYVAGGCWEVAAEGAEICTVGLHYLNLPLLLPLCLGAGQINEFLDGVLPDDALLDAPAFEAFLKLFLRKMEAVIGKWATLRGDWAKPMPEVNPTPFLSAALWDCVKNHKDQTEGGCRYNPENISAVGLATLADSLAAVKTLCFERKILSVRELGEVLKSDWAGREDLRQQALAAPKFGSGDSAADILAARLHSWLTAFAATLKNERGDCHRVDYFGAYNHVGLGAKTPATPDGRKAGELLSQSVTPGRLRRDGSLTDIVNAVRHMDFGECSGGASLDLSLPFGCEIPTPALAAFIRAAGAAGAPTLQLSSVNLAELKDAQDHPERHQGLTVRVYGLSMRFVDLNRVWQEEFINRGVKTC